MTRSLVVKVTCGTEALNGDTDGPDATQPQRSDAEVLESQAEEQPADE